MNHKEHNGKPHNGKELVKITPVKPAVTPVRAKLVKIDTFNQEKFERSLKIISGILTVIGVAATTIVKIMETAKTPPKAKKRAKKAAPKRYMRRRQNQQVEELNRLLKATAKLLEKEVKNVRLSFK